MSLEKVNEGYLNQDLFSLTFLRPVKRRHLLDFFFIAKLGGEQFIAKFQGEQVSLAKERLLDLCLLAE